MHMIFLDQPFDARERIAYGEAQLAPASHAFVPLITTCGVTFAVVSARDVSSRDAVATCDALGLSSDVTVGVARIGGMLTVCSAADVRGRCSCVCASA